MSTLNVAGVPRTTDVLRPSPTDAIRPAAGLPRPAHGDLRQLVIDSTTALLAAERHRTDEIWSSALNTVQESLVRLEKACDVAFNAPSTAASDAVDLMVQRFVAVANDEAQAAADRTRVECEGHLAELRAVNQSLARDLEKEKATLRAALDALSGEREARAETDAALAAMQGCLSQNRTQLEQLRAELSSLETKAASFERQVATEREERERLTAIVRAVQRTVGHVGKPEPNLTAAVESFATVLADRESADETTHGEAIAGDDHGTPAPAQAQRSLTLVTLADLRAPESQRELPEYVRQLLEDVEKAYDADIAAEQAPSEVIRRLTDNLGAARRRCVAAAPRREHEATMSFEEGVRVLLNTAGTSSFGRHLGIAIHDLYLGVAPASWTQARLAG